MPTTINAPSGILTTRQLQSLRLTTACTALDITAKLGDTQIFAATLWAYAGRVDLPLQDVAEAAHKLKTAIIVTLHIEASDHLTRNPELITDIPVIHSPLQLRGAGSTAEWLQSEFLTTLRARRVPANTAYIAMRYVAPHDEQGTSKLIVTARDADSDAAPYVTQIDKGAIAQGSDGWDDYTLAYSDAAVRQTVADQGHIRPEQVQVLAVTFIAGARTATFFFDHTMQPDTVIKFRNQFKAEESIFLSSTQYKGTLTTQEATLQGREATYDTRTAEEHISRTFPVISKDEMRWLLKAAATHNAYIEYTERDDDAISINTAPIIITSIEAEHTGSDSDEPPVAKLTWRYADPDQYQAEGTPYGIFTRQFTPPFT